MNLEEGRKQIIEAAKSKETFEHLKKAGIGQPLPEGSRQVELDSSEALLFGNELEAYVLGDKYFLVREGIVVYGGNIDRPTGDLTPQFDLNEFPLSTVITILTGMGNYETVERLLNQDHIFMEYISEVYKGVAKSVQNGHMEAPEGFNEEVAAKL